MLEINFVNGNLLEASTEALVNAVNANGIMGKGIALEFKKAFPNNFKAYKIACGFGKVNPGGCFYFIENNKHIINAVTKGNWWEKSKLHHVTSAIDEIIKRCRLSHILSISIPKIGCGNGGLDWEVVKKEIVDRFNASGLDIVVNIYE